MKAPQILSIDRVLETMYIHAYDATETIAAGKRTRAAIRLRLRQRPARFARHHPILRFGISSRRTIHRAIRSAARTLANKDRHTSAVGYDSFDRSNHSQPHTPPPPPRPLLREKLIERIPGSDRREQYLQLTALGRKQLRKTLPNWQRAQARLRKSLGEKDWNQMQKLLTRAVEATQQA